MPPIIDFHFHIGRYHEYHPWVIDWVKTQADNVQDLEAFLESVLTPEGDRLMANFLRMAPGGER